MKNFKLSSFILVIGLVFSMGVMAGTLSKKTYTPLIYNGYLAFSPEALDENAAHLCISDAKSRFHL
ncbi:hypothetical protein [Crenothrix sp.]|uniref:hypothetical protein n=1 Tax=Crenothrix sp. TaxID=3100433 RepID=UPI00374D3A88